MTRKQNEEAKPSDADATDLNPKPYADRSDLEGPPPPRPAPVTNLKPCEPNMADEASDPALQNVEYNPRFVRDDVRNTSTSSGTHAGDEGDDQRRKELLKRGHREVSRMD